MRYSVWDEVLFDFGAKQPDGTYAWIYVLDEDEPC